MRGYQLRRDFIKANTNLLHGLNIFAQVTGDPHAQIRDRAVCIYLALRRTCSEGKCRRRRCRSWVQMALRTLRQQAK